MYNIDSDTIHLVGYYPLHDLETNALDRPYRPHRPQPPPPPPPLPDRYRPNRPEIQDDNERPENKYKGISKSLRTEGSFVVLLVCHCPRFKDTFFRSTFRRTHR